MTEAEQLIADQADLESFARLPPAERQVTNRLKGVLAETAVTGVIRYPWPLLQPLLAHVMQEQLAKYEAEEHVEIGPARPLLDSDGGSVQQLGERFCRLLSGFESHPWTLQRLCEVVLEPQKQYKRLHKLALAIEKLLLVTGVLELSEQPGPLPPLSHLARVNEAPPPPAGSAAAAGSNAASRQGNSDGSGLVAAALSIRQQPQQAAAAAAADAAGVPPAAAAAAAAAADPMQVDTPTTAAGAGAAAAPAAENGGPDVTMESEPPAAAGGAGGAAPEAAAVAAPAAAGDTEMLTTEEQAPTVTEHVHVDAVGTPPAAAGGAGPAGAS